MQLLFKRIIALPQACSVQWAMNAT